MNPATDKNGAGSKKNPPLRVFIFALIMPLAIPLMGTGELGHGPSLNSFLGKLVTSVVLFGGLIILLRKRLIEFFSQKRLQIGDDIKNREQEIKRQEDRLQSLIERLGKMEEEIRARLLEAKESGEREKSRILESGKVEIQRILSEARQEIDEKVEISLEKMKDRIAQATVEQFKESIQKELDQPSHEKIIRNNIKIMGDAIARERK